jgi:L-ascorbate metabolism protein UlaG (beta-lactamase superfamily)
MLVETRNERILVDPWLTDRLDRFWEHWPPLPKGIEAELYPPVDAIVFTHHHFDHHHFPSLSGLALCPEADFDETLAERATTRCFYPRGSAEPRFSVSGLGHQTIAWTLRRLGFTNVTGVNPGETLRIGETTMRTFPSRVPFPEMSLVFETSEGTAMLCGDSLLHPQTAEAFTQAGRPHIDVAFIPAHSISLPGVLTERRQVTRPGEVQQRARANFARYVTTINPDVVVPSSFGWRVAGEGSGDFLWANRTIFPFTPVEALSFLGETGRAGRLCGPGERVLIERGAVEVEAGQHVAAPYDFETTYAEVTLDPTVPVPAFDPASDRWGEQRESAESMVNRLLDAVVGTDYWYRAVESGDTHIIEISGDDGDSGFALDLTSQRAPRVSTGQRDLDHGYTHIAGSTLQVLLDADLLFGSSYGLWVSTENLLSAAFHQPRYYVRHVEKVLPATPASFTL